MKKKLITPILDLDMKWYLRLMSAIPLVVSIFISGMIASEKNIEKEVESQNQTQSPTKRKLAPLTIERLRTYKGLENLTDQEAENIIYSFKVYAEITYKLFNRSNNQFC